MRQKLMHVLVAKFGCPLLKNKELTLVFLVLYMFVKKSYTLIVCNFISEMLA